MTVRVIHDDMLAALPTLDDASIDSAVTDPPYHLQSIVKRFGKEGAAPAKPGKTGAYARASSGFMGKQWDGGDIAFRPETWGEVLRVLRPGAHLLAFGGTRTFHRVAVAVEDAGFEIRDTIMWLYGSGFPKSHNQDGEWEGWGTALKPAVEPIIMARKPLVGTVAANLAEYNTGALNIDGCRVHGEDAQGGEYRVKRFAPGATVNATGVWKSETEFVGSQKPGRWPANVIHDGSDEVLAAFPDAPGQMAAVTGAEKSSPFANVYGDMPKRSGRADPRGDAGSAARFFYQAKATKADRLGSKHPTVKPVDLIRYLVRLVTPPGGTVLDCFAGSGTTGMAAMAEGFNAILIEREAEYIADIQRRLDHVAGADGDLFAPLQEAEPELSTGLRPIGDITRDIVEKARGQR